ncbi:hypothetical protein O9993_18925 [Vibrio lentus]|nr:hypothetical protein [Vibrio lentus]
MGNLFWKGLIRCNSNTNVLGFSIDVVKGKQDIAGFIFMRKQRASRCLCSIVWWNIHINQDSAMLLLMKGCSIVTAECQLFSKGGGQIILMKKLNLAWALD